MVVHSTTYFPVNWLKLLYNLCMSLSVGTMSMEAYCHKSFPRITIKFFLCKYTQVSPLNNLPCTVFSSVPAHYIKFQLKPISLTVNKVSAPALTMFKFFKLQL